MNALIRLVRPRQWIKNSLVFAAIIFSQHYSSPADWIKTITAFFAFCFAAGSIYIINDLFDAEEDRAHPVKRYRPIAAGEVSTGRALFLAFVMTAGAVSLSLAVNIQSFIIISAYIVMMFLYSLFLKNILLLDVFIISGGLTARAVMGAAAIEVSTSKWLLVCTFFIALMLALVKRRQELARVGELKGKVRRSLTQAPPLKVWDAWITMVSGITILGYTLYTLDPVTVEKIGSHRMLYTMPFVVFALLRYQIAVYSDNMGEDPTETILGDRWILAAILGWAVVVALVITHVL